MQAEIAIERQNDYQIQAVQHKLEQALHGLDLLKNFSGRKVLLKPNCTGIYSPENGLTTHPAALEATAVILREAGAKVIIGESSTFGIDTQTAFIATGVAEVAQKLDINLIDFKKSRYINCRLKDWLVFKNLRLPEEVLQTDYVISLAKLKTNYVTGISGVMKNMKGVLTDTQKREFHRQGLSAAVVDLISLLRQHVSLVGVTDGILGSELFNPKNAGVLVASTDLVACDAVCSYIMGIDAAEIEHLQLGKIQRLGETDIDRMSFLGEPLFSVETSFKSSLPGLRYLAEEFKIHILDGKPCSTCIGGLYHSLKKVRSVKPQRLDNLRIAIGKWSGEDINSNTICFGNCAHRKNGRFNVVGCCPTSADFLEILDR